MIIRRDQSIIWVSGDLSDNRSHSHHALQVTWARPGGFARLSVGTELFEGACVIVDGGITHSLEMQAGLIALIDSESALAAGIRNRYLSAAQVAVVEHEWHGELDELDIEAWAGIGNEREFASEMDERIILVLGWLDEFERSGRWHEVTLIEALKRTHLSESRFLHLFSEHVGTPWRSYLVWRRALVAMTCALRGASLTDSAHAAGYADSAHLSRQFVALFGVTPAAFARGANMV